MDKVKARKIEITMMVAGALVGFIIGYDWSRVQFLKDYKPWLLALLGGAIGVACRPVYLSLKSSGHRFHIETVDLDLGFLGKFKIKLDNVSRPVAWSLFVEMTTRIASQPLGKSDGIIREALESLYKLFEVTRTELKKLDPSPAPSDPNVRTLEMYAVQILNEAIRPCLARWHPRLLLGEKTGLPESEWLLAESCRADLEATRLKIVEYTKGFARMLKISYLEQLLIKPEQPLPGLLSNENLAQIEKGLNSTLTETQKAVGWHIFVELFTRVSTQTLDEQGGRLREALDSLYKLYDIIRKELVLLSPTLPTVSEKTNTVENIALHVLNGELRQFLSEWHPKLSAWESTKVDGEKARDESQWTENDAFRKALAKARVALYKDTMELGQLIGVQNVNMMLPISAE